MATAAKTKVDSLAVARDAVGAPVEDDPDVARAAQAMEKTAADATVAQQQRGRFEAILDHNRHIGASVSEGEVLEAHEQIAGARVEDARAARRAIEARMNYERAIEEVRLRRVELVDEAADLVRPIVIETGRRFLQALQAGAEIDALRHLTLTGEQRWCSAMVGGAFERLAIVLPEQLAERLGALERASQENNE